MLSKSLLALAVVAALVVPAGLALAAASADDTTGNGPTEAAETTADPIRDQDRVQLHDPGQCADRPWSDVDGVALQTQTRNQVQARLHDPEDCDGDAIQHQRQLQIHTQMQTEAGGQARYQAGSSDGDGQYPGANGTGPRGPAAGSSPVPSAGRGGPSSP